MDMQEVLNKEQMGMRHGDALADILRGHRVIIQTHNMPDPDAIASAFGLQYLLGCYGIESMPVYDGELTKLSGIKMLDYLGINIINIRELPNPDESDCVVLVDCQKYNKNTTDIVGREVAAIDHHPTVIDCEYEYRDVRLVGACASIIASYIEEADLEITPEVATALLYGLKMDTSDFNRGVTEFDIRMFYYLYKYADHEVLKRLSVNTMEFGDLKAYGAAINNITLHENMGFACIPFDCPDALAAIISDFMLALDVVEFSLVYCVRSSGYKFSARCELPYVDCGKVMRKAMEVLGGSGGGHSFMSGGFIPKEAVNLNAADFRTAIEREFIAAVTEDIKANDKRKSYTI